ncbi:MAG: hypothetical protein HKN82_10545 [Akkermansiaceae bacterium]|nr:hypothetical protein [Akkermansiaceae bacterium]NNM29377.1 hypothetical protein [Akkermansiaceae bacterium]
MKRRGKSIGTAILALIVGAVMWWLDHRGELAEEQKEYERLADCRLVPDRGNDGDSFHVKVPDGRTVEFRLYYVDAPESGVRTYRDGNDNRARIRHQGDYFGGLGQMETTGLGEEAKKWTTRMLGDRGFTVYTRWKPVFGGPRCYAFVELEHEGRKRWLHELLVEEGLARIYTEGAKLPNGTNPGAQKDRLNSLQLQAKRRGRGGWGLAE